MSGLSNRSCPLSLGLAAWVPPTPLVNGYRTSHCVSLWYFFFAFLISATHVLSETELSPIFFFSSFEFKLPILALRDSDKQTHSATFIFLPNQCFPLNLMLPPNYFSFLFCSQPYNVVLSLVTLTPNFFSFILRSMSVFCWFFFFFFELFSCYFRGKFERFSFSLVKTKSQRFKEFLVFSYSIYTCFEFTNVWFFALLFDFVLRVVLSSLMFDIIMLEILMLMLLPC